MSFQYPLILDGGFATELERSFGKDLSGKLWSAQCIQDDPEAIKSVHKFYYEAGANVATTCSYQASMEGFIRAGYSEHHAVTLMRKSVSLALEARDEYKQAHPNDDQQRLVALSIGCYGAVLANGAEYTGDYDDMTLQQLVQFHKERLSLFLSTTTEADSVDLVVFETIPSYLEAQAIQDIVSNWDVKDIALPLVAVSFQCRSDDQIADGTPVLNALQVLNDVEGVFAIGINCTKPKYVENLFATVAQFNKQHQNGKALIAYPDGGEEWNAVARSWDDSAKLPEETFGCMMAKCVQDYGPRVLVGGCCGTGPAHIKNIKEFVNKK
ncbi:Dicer-like protein 1 [Mucor velutinosus]|uniref:Dicer-like protein 1 n=1 Tax=Mucor velutinosus TaxID=708070 RepID=A0AAN7DGH9_9FUNG|nr:Dicer-like protein 1 [Mucor velutinosus]